MTIQRYRKLDAMVGRLIEHFCAPVEVEQTARQRANLRKFVNRLIARFCAPTIPPEPEPETKDACEICGKKIPPLPIGDDPALCVACRYSADAKSAPYSKPSEFEVELQQTPAPDREPSPVAELICDLQEIGCAIPDAIAAAAAMECAFDKVGDARAAEFLRLLFQRLKGKRGREIQLAISGTFDDAGSLREEAAALGIKAPTLLVNVQRLRKRIFGKNV